jgi:type IV fimbrial biogenesis protein FimT
MAREARDSQAGFTLAELMVAVTVLAVALTIGTPALSAVVQGAREANAYYLLTSSFAAARIEAVKRGAPVSVCPSVDGVSCSGDVVWDHGWIVFSDPGRSEQPADAWAIMQHVDGVGGTLALRSTGGRRQVRFTPDGWSYGSNLSVRLCTSDARLLGKVVVSNSGRPRTERSAAGDACPFRP